MYCNILRNTRKTERGVLRFDSGFLRGSKVLVPLRRLHEQVEL